MAIDTAAVRRDLARFDRRSVRARVVALASTWCYWAAATVGALRLPWWPARAGSGLVGAVFAVNLFLVAHDAGHGAFTARPRVDRFVGRTAMLPTFQPFSLWAHLHNRVHHRWTNLRGADIVWVPLDKPGYDALAPVDRWVYRLERSTAGFGVYYGREIWWRVLMRTPAGSAPDRREFTTDRRLAVSAAVALSAVAVATGRGGPVGSWFTAVALPWAAALWMIGTGTYFNHTHPEVRWYADRDEWARADIQVTGALELRHPRLLATVLGNVMEHPAHHVNPRVPLPMLREAEDHLRLGPGSGAVVSERWSPATHRRVVRTCKLYDFEAGRWVGWDGLPHTMSSSSTARTAASSAGTVPSSSVANSPPRDSSSPG